MFTDEEISAQFPSDSSERFVRIAGDPALSDRLNAAFLKKTATHLSDKFDVQWLIVYPYGAPPTMQVGFKPKKGGAIFWSDALLWEAGLPYYTITNELAAIA